MAQDRTATIHLKTTPTLRNRASGALRMNGVTMQAFLARVLELVVAHDPRVTSVIDELRNAALDAP
jgi:hypothetical protein